jgi:hypothetical protein
MSAIQMYVIPTVVGLLKWKQHNPEIGFQGVGTVCMGEGVGVKEGGPWGARGVFWGGGERCRRKQKQEPSCGEPDTSCLVVRLTGACRHPDRRCRQDDRCMQTP